MKNLLLLLAAVVGLSIAAAFGSQATGSAGAQQNTNVPSHAGALWVNSPKANERLPQTFVNVTYQLVDRGMSASPSPSFTIQLDGNEPVTTTSYDYTFTGLTAGAHTVTVTLVNANGTPIANPSVSTKFTVVAGNRTGGTPSSFFHPASSMQMASGDVASLPDASTPLPMLSLVGFVVLVGGICTAIRAR